MFRLTVNNIGGGTKFEATRISQVSVLRGADCLARCLYVTSALLITDVISSKRFVPQTFQNWGSARLKGCSPGLLDPLIGPTTIGSGMKKRPSHFTGPGLSRGKHHRNRGEHHRNRETMDIDALPATAKQLVIQHLGACDWRSLREVGALCHCNTKTVLSWQSLFACSSMVPATKSHAQQLSSGSSFVLPSKPLRHASAGVQVLA